MKETSVTSLEMIAEKAIKIKEKLMKFLTGAKNIEDRLDEVLEDNELILNRANDRLDRMEKRQEKMETMLQVLDGMMYFIEWQDKKKVE